MKIILILPRLEHGVSIYSDKVSWASIILGYPEITLPHIASLTPSKHNVKLINESYQNINYDQDVDLVGISCLTMFAHRAYHIADEFRKRGITVVLGGYHPSALPEEAKQHADSVVIGEAENTWPQLLSDFEKGQLKPFYKPYKEIDMSKIPSIRRDLIKHKTFLGSIQTTRGCPYNCEFCAIPSFLNHDVRHRPIKNVVDEIKQMPNKLFLIHDPSITSDIRYAKKLFKALIEENIKKTWLANGNVNVLSKVDKEFLKLAKKAGCIEWFIGFESVNQESLNGIKKTCNRVEQFKKTIKKIHNLGMVIQGGIIFGFDEDTPDIFERTIDQVYEWGIDILEINILTPYPGTALFKRLEKEKRILSKDWSRYNQTDVVFKPKNMSEKELFEGTRKVAKEFYSVPKMLTRMGKILLNSKRLGGLMPAGTNLAYRRYYRRDYGF